MTTSTRAPAAQDLLRLSIGELAAGFVAKRFSPVEVTAAVLQAAEASQASINAFVSIDHEGAMAAARDAEQRHLQGRALGPLDGIPISIKDMIDVQGLPTRRGSRLTEGAPPAEADAPVVRALRTGGAVLFGKTTTSEFGWAPVSDSPHTGTTRHPLAPGLSVGGSSAGAAAHVAAVCGPLAIGSDAGGSVRVPASYCGLVGFKPTHGVIAQAPLSAYGDFSHIGPLTRSVADCISTMAVLSSPDARDPSSLFPRTGLLDAPAHRRLRVGWSRRVGTHTLPTPAIDTHFDALLSTLVEDVSAAEVELVPVDLTWMEVADALWPVWTTRLYEQLKHLPQGSLALLDPRVLRIFEAGRDTTIEAVADGRIRMRELASRLTTLFTGIDLLLTPTTASPALPHGELAPPGHPLASAIRDSGNNFAAQPFCYPFNVTQQPAISVPLGKDAHGMPFGVQIVGGKFADGLVLQFARRVEALSARAH